MSLIGNYETATVYYQGVIQQIHRLLATIEDPGRKLKWQQIQGEVAQEYDVVKNIVQTLALFKGIVLVLNSSPFFFTHFDYCTFDHIIMRSSFRK